VLSVGNSDGKAQFVERKTPWPRGILAYVRDMFTYAPEAGSARYRWKKGGPQSLFRERFVDKELYNSSDKTHESE
jgi:hypothetical protein